MSTEKTLDSSAFAAELRRKLTDALAPSQINLTDDSAKHTGHAGAKPGGGTHFRLRLVSDKFKGLNLPARHRLIYAALADDLKDRVHALQIQALAPGEDA